MFRLLQSIFCFVGSSHLAVATCYRADGVTTVEDIPCDTSTGTSACCGADDYCLENGLCLNSGMLVRGSCTDPKWGAPCNKICPDNDPNSFLRLQTCGGQWSCTNGDCSNTVALQGGRQIVLRKEQLAGLGLTKAITLAATDTVPATACTATVTSSFQFSTVSRSAIQPDRRC